MKRQEIRTSRPRHAGSVLVTGASSGIGEATALALDRQGFSVFAGVRRKDAAEQLRQKASERLTPLLLDVTDRASIACAAERLQQCTGENALHGLVNNAGIAVGGPLEYVPIEALREQLEVNVVGTVAVTQAMLPLLRRAAGRIVNIGSTSGRLATPLIGSYCASKFALEAITEVLRLELRPSDIHVIDIVPGIIRTPMWDKSIAAFEALINDLPPEGQALYKSALLAARDYAKGLRGTPAEKVARKVVQALTAKKPRIQYIVGENALAELAAASLPRRLRGRLISLVFPIKRADSHSK